MAIIDAWAQHPTGPFLREPMFASLMRWTRMDPSQLPGDHSVIQFKFKDLVDQADWWLLVDGDKVDICITPPGRDVDVYFTTTTRAMHDVWMGDRSYRDAILSGDLLVEGEAALTRRVSTWLRPSVFSDSKRAPIPQPLAD